MKMSVYSSRYHVSASSAVRRVFRDFTVKELLASREKGVFGLWCNGGLWARNLASCLIPLKMDVQLSWEYCHKKTKTKGTLSSLVPSGGSGQISGVLGLGARGSTQPSNPCPSSYFSVFFLYTIFLNLPPFSI